MRGFTPNAGTNGGMDEFFSRFARSVETGLSRPLSTVIAFGLIVVWAITGPFVHFTDTWQLVINTTTTIVTFLMVFILNNSQHRDTVAMNAKLDELLKHIDGSNKQLVGAEQQTDRDVERTGQRVRDRQ